MAKITYQTKLCKTEFSSPEKQFNFDIPVPRFCPICQCPQRGTAIDRKFWNIDNGQYYGTVMYTCNNCSKKYLVTYDLDTKLHSGRFGSFYPVLSASYENDLLAPISPRFIELYNQALRAETAGDKDLAATGYRDALECLVKDYAIVELHADADKTRKMSLFEAIGTHLDPDMVKAADVIRILGNDFTHYERKYPEHDFELLKSYLDLFISLIENRIRINHPPVSRE